jgi:hypothetical protein
VPNGSDVQFLGVDGDMVGVGVTDAAHDQPRGDLPGSSRVHGFDGVPYLRPEVQLLHKSGGCRPKDQADFDATWPLLDPTDRHWLRHAIELAHPGHRWLQPLQG